MDTVVEKSSRTSNPSADISISAARISLFSGAAFMLLLAGLHVLKPELDPSWSVISEYGLGRFGWTMRIAFLALGLSAVSLFVAIRNQVPNMIGRIGLVFLLIGAAGPILAGIFPMDPISTPIEDMTISGTVHSLGAMLSDGILIAATLVTLSLVRKNPKWSAHRKPLILATVLAWVGTIVFTGSMAVLVPQNGGQLGPDVFIGWQSRFVVIAYTTWLMTAAWCSIKVHTDTA